MVSAFFFLLSFLFRFVWFSFYTQEKKKNRSKKKCSKETVLKKILRRVERRQREQKTKIIAFLHTAVLVVANIDFIGAIVAVITSSPERVPFNKYIIISIAVLLLLPSAPPPPLRPIDQYLILAICSGKPSRVVPLPKQNLYVNFNWWIMGWTEETFHASRESTPKQKRKKKQSGFPFFHSPTNSSFLTGVFFHLLASHRSLFFFFFSYPQHSMRQ